MSGRLPVPPIPPDYPPAPAEQSWPRDPTPAGPPPPPGPAYVIKTPDARTPRGGIAINKRRMDDLLIEYSVTNNRNFTADTWTCTLALREDKAAPVGLAFWGNTDKMEVELFAGLSDLSPPSDSLILGRVDDVEIDFPRRLVMLRGRDYTAEFLEATVYKNWPNNTSSEIATILAQSHGMTPVVTETSTPVGLFYRQDRILMADGAIEWTLLTYLAEQEGFDVFVRGRELHFGPPPDARAATRWALRYQQAGTQNAYPEAPAGNLRMRRNLTVAQSFIVKVISWNAKHKKAFIVSRRSVRGAGRAASGQFQSSQTYVYRLPGLTEEQAVAEAERRLKDLSRHERQVDVSGLPGDPKLDVRMIMALSGTGTAWDQDYRLDEVERHMSYQGGFTMRIRGRNLSPSQTATLT